MNTQTDVSGLVAVAEVTAEKGLTYNGRPVLSAGTVLVRLSDAEAIISAKNAEIERLCNAIATATDGVLSLDTAISQQAERIKEQSAALKLARETIVMWQNCSLFEPSVSACERKSDEAIAAIDALGE